jgi:hypothetical protein
MSQEAKSLLWMCDNREVGRIVVYKRQTKEGGGGGWRKLHNEDIHTLYFT